MTVSGPGEGPTEAPGKELEDADDPDLWDPDDCGALDCGEGAADEP